MFFTGFVRILSRTFQHSCTSPVCSWTFLHLWWSWIQCRPRLNLCLGKRFSLWTHLYWDGGGLHVSVWRDVLPLESWTRWHILQRERWERFTWTHQHMLLQICTHCDSCSHSVSSFLFGCFCAFLLSCAWVTRCLHEFKCIHFLQHLPSICRISDLCVYIM